MKWGKVSVFLYNSVTVDMIESNRFITTNYLQVNNIIYTIFNLLVSRGLMFISALENYQLQWVAITKTKSSVFAISHGESALFGINTAQLV